MQVNKVISGDFIASIFDQEWSDEMTRNQMQKGIRENCLHKCFKMKKIPCLSSFTNTQSIIIYCSFKFKIIKWSQNIFRFNFLTDFYEISTPFEIKKIGHKIGPRFKNVSKFEIFNFGLLRILLNEVIFVFDMKCVALIILTNEFQDFPPYREWEILIMRNFRKFCLKFLKLIPWRSPKMYCFCKSASWDCEIFLKN